MCIHVWVYYIWDVCVCYAVYSPDEKMIFCLCKDAACYGIYSLDENIMLCLCKNDVCYAVYIAVYYALYSPDEKIKNNIVSV